MGSLARTPRTNPDMSGFVRPDIKPDITGSTPKGCPGMSGVPVRSGCPEAREDSWQMSPNVRETKSGDIRYAGGARITRNCLRVKCRFPAALETLGDIRNVPLSRLGDGQ